MRIGKASAGAAADDVAADGEFAEEFTGPTFAS